MASFEHTVSRNLQCPICFDLLSDPKQLSCTHTFCKKCLGDILASQNRANTVRCPICRSTTDVKDGNVENLNTNVPLKSLVDDVRNCKQLCEMCDKKSRAVRFCCDCGMHLCNPCLERHNNWPPNLNHKVVSVEDIREGKVVLEKKVYCQERVHKSDGLEDVCTDVCTTCKKLICTRCRMIYHTKEKGHTVQDAEEYNASITTEIESLLNRGKTKVTVIRSHMTFVESQVKRVTEHIEGEKSKLNNEYEDFTNRLSERRVALYQQLEAQKGEFCERLQKMKGADERSIASIECASVLASKILKAPLESDIVAIRDSLSDELKDVVGRDDPEKKTAEDISERAEQLTFTLNKQRDRLPGHISTQVLNYVGICVIVLVLSVVCHSYFSVPDLQLRNHRAWSQYDLKCDVELSVNCLVEAMVVTPDGRMAVGCRNGGIAIFSADGQLQRKVLKYVKISGLGFLSDGRYVIIDVFNTITLYPPKFLNRKLDVTFATLDHNKVGFIGVLTVDSNDLIYVSYRKAQKIQVFSPLGGEAIREIPCDGYTPLQITSYDNVLIVQQYSHVMMIIDKKGSIKHKLTKTTDYTLYAGVSNSNSVLIASVSYEEGLLSIDEYTSEVKHMTNLISDFKFKKSKEGIEYDYNYNIKQFRSGEIAFCTPDKLYIFHQSKILD